MAYTSRQIPTGGDLEEFKRWLATELSNIQAAQTGAVEKLQLKMIYAPPVKYGDGTVVLADGTTWNPGAGQGYYGYYGGSWKKLG